MEYIRFLQKKIKDYSIRALIRLEFESFFFGIFSYIPTTGGVVLRAFLAKLFFKSVGGVAWIQPRSIFIHTERLQIGSHFAINSGCYINAIGGIEIGNHVLIGSNVTISSGMHPYVGDDVPIISRPVIPKSIIIEDDVWIGAGAVLVPGIRLARGTVVGANAVVTKDTEPYSINVGVPARKVKDRRDVVAD